jgi:mono/diheme cytochrome c family protein
MRTRSARARDGLFGVLVSAVFVTLGMPAERLAAQESSEDELVTFTRDIAPILQQNCQICHRPGSVAPFSLVTYQDARRYSRRIKDQVARRLMPPYHLDAGVGIQDIKGDWRLSEEQIETVVSWVDAGTPEGDPADMPTSPEFADKQMWQQEELLGPPDHVIKTLPFDVPAEGGDTWWRPVVPTGITSERYIRAMEVRPSFPAGRQVVHHANPKLLRLNEDGEYQPMGNLSEYAMGKIGEIVPADAGRLIKPTDRIEWDTHYYPMGFDVEGDQIELGIWFHPEGFEPEFRQNLRLYPLRGDITLEPGGTAMTQGFYRWDHPVRIDSFQPHGHVHLHGMSVQAVMPDGKVELLNMVSDFDARWHHSYIYEDDASPLLPAGTVIVMTGWYENTEQNPLTDPTAWYARGSRTVDEMSHAWIAVTHLTDEGFERLVEEREAKVKIVSDDGSS